MKKLKWFLKQLLPFTYRSKYSGEGKNYFCVWNMWFGRIYNKETYEIAQEIEKDLEITNVVSLKDIPTSSEIKNKCINQHKEEFQSIIQKYNIPSLLENSTKNMETNICIEIEAEFTKLGTDWSNYMLIKSKETKELNMLKSFFKWKGYHVFIEPDKLFTKLLLHISWE